MGEQYDRATSEREIVRAIRECRRGQGHKDGPVEYAYTALGSGAKLRREVRAGRYHARKGREVQIYRPKRRTAIAPWFRDRVWQRAMCNNGVYDDLTRGFVASNIACQRGKGQDMAIRMVVRNLQELYWSAPSAPIYVDHLDVIKYFPSTPHRLVHELDQARIKEPLYLPYLAEIVEMQQDNRPADEITADPFGARGTGLGSQINQLHQIALLDDIDHDVIKLVPRSIRYNDDYLLLSHSREAIAAASSLIGERLEQRGLRMQDKAGITTAGLGFYFLRKRFIVCDGGKILIRLSPEAIAQERHALLRMRRAIDEGRCTIEHVQRHYQSWVANAEYAGDAPIRAMDRHYKITFGEEPKYIRTRRYLYGRPYDTAGARAHAGGRK